MDNPSKTDKARQKVRFGYLVRNSRTGTFFAYRHGQYYASDEGITWREIPEQTMQFEEKDSLIRVEHDVANYMFSQLFAQERNDFDD